MLPPKKPAGPKTNLNAKASAISPWLRVQAMFLIRWLFRCRHKDFSFPQTVKGRCYVACLECGSEFEYDWKEMKVIK